MRISDWSSDVCSSDHQELDIEELIRPVTKYATMVTDPRAIRYHLEKALYLATSGRPGPVWLDIPLDVQAAKIDPDDLLPGFDPAELDEPWKATDVDAAAAEILARIAGRSEEHTSELQSLMRIS